MILVDTCVWLEYLAGKSNQTLEDLLEKDMCLIDDIIFAELFPIFYRQKDTKSISLLESLPSAPLSLDFKDITCAQVKNIMHGLNAVGLLDIALAQQASIYETPIYTFDKHFFLMSQWLNFPLFSSFSPLQ